MRLFTRFGLHSLAWSARRLHCPVGPDALVLEIGSGGNPYPRANVLVDAYVSTRERHWVPLRADRPTVLAYGENLPFKDKTFDFVIACHVLEHSSEPEQFLREIQRVGKAGYIETPDAFMERINPYRDHRLEVTVREDQLIIRKKATWRASEETVELYEHMAKPHVAGYLIPRRPRAFHVRYYWEDSPRWKVLNPDVSADWPADGERMHQSPSPAPLRGAMLDAFQWAFSQSSRNDRLDVSAMLCCPVCKSGGLSRKSGVFVCQGCSREYTDECGLPNFKGAA